MATGQTSAVSGAAPEIKQAHIDMSGSQVADIFWGMLAIVYTDGMTWSEWIESPYYTVWPQNGDPSTTLKIIAFGNVLELQAEMTGSSSQFFATISGAQPSDAIVAGQVYATST